MSLDLLGWFTMSVSHLYIVCDGPFFGSLVIDPIQNSVVYIPNQGFKGIGTKKIIMELIMTRCIYIVKGILDTSLYMLGMIQILSQNSQIPSSYTCYHLGSCYPTFFLNQKISWFPIFFSCHFNGTLILLITGNRSNLAIRLPRMTFTWYGSDDRLSRIEIR